MRKFINLVALAALLFVPWVANAQSYETVPYSTGFEGLSTGDLPTGWVAVQTGNSGSGTFPSAYAYAGNAHNSSVYLEFETTTGQTEILALPMMQDISTLKLTFWASAQSYYLPTRFEVGVIEVNGSDTTFVPVDTITFITSTSWVSGYNLYTVYFNNYTGSGERIAMRATGGSGQYTLMLDDFTVSSANVPDVSLPASAATNINTDLTITATLQGPTTGINYAWSSQMATAGNATMNNVDNVLTINYTAAGIDTVTLTVSNASGSNSASMVVRAMDLSPVTTYPYTTGFEADQDINWNFVNGDNGWYIGSATNNGGSNALYVSSDNGANNTYNTSSTSNSYAYRYFQFAAGEYVYSYDWKCQGEGGYSNYDYMKMYIATPDADFTASTISTSGWTDISGYLLSHDSWQNANGTFTIDAAGLYPVVFYWTNDNYMGNQPPAAVDNIMITPLTCPAVSGLVLDSATQETLTLHWHPVGEETAWAVTVGEEDPVIVNDTIYTAYNLTSNTAYTVVVRAVCGAGDTSMAVSSTFRTECGPITLPFSDDFDSYANGYWPPCWHRLRAYDTDPSVNAQFHHSGTQAMFLLANNDTNLFCTPAPIPTTGNNIYVRYHAYMQSNSYYTYNMWIKAGVMTDTSDVTTFIALDSLSYHNFNNVFEEREFNTANLDATQTYWVAWMYSSNTGNLKGAIDDVYISEIPSCLRVSAITASSIIADTIVLSWVDNVNSSATYSVSYWTATSDTTTINTTDTFYVFDGLSANTVYYFSVMPICGGDDAEAVTASFRTACGATPIPFMEGFDNAGSLSCWQVLNPAYSTGYSSSYGRTSSGCFLFYFTTNPPEYLISPELTDTENGLKLEFYYKQYSSNFAESFKVGYSTTSDSTSAFVWGEEITDATSSYQLYSTIMPAGTKYVAIQYTANNAYGLYIDDINFMEPPACMPVSGLYADDITANGATLHWTAPEGQSSFIVRLDSTDYDVSGDTSYTFSDLEARTSYTAYVATDCGGDTSEWVSTTFTTDCLNGSCEIVISMVDNDYYSWGASAAGRVATYQNGELVKYSSINGDDATAVDSVNVCSGMPVTFRWVNGSYSYWASDCAFTIYDGGGSEIYSCTSASGLDSLTTVASACPSCLTPTGVRASAVDSNSITFVWNEVDSVSSYVISFNGEDEIVGYNGTETFTNLTANTAYTFYVKAVCIPGEDTSAARTITVKTTCGQMTLPLVESFENDADGSVPSCWNVVSGSPAVEAMAYYAHTGSKSLELGHNEMIATSQVPLSGDSIYVSFWTDIYIGTLTAGVMTNVSDETTFTPLLTVNGTNDYEFFEFNTSTLSPDSSYYVAFRFLSSSGSANIDDINIRVFEGCMYPTNLVANGAANGASLSWNYSGTINNFVVEYRPVGTTTWTIIDTITTTTATLTGLDASTSYEVRVGAICSDTLWADIASFTTSCDIVSTPYFENFYSATMDLPACWDFTDRSKFSFNNWLIDPNDGHGYSGPGDGTMMAKSNSAGEYAILPRLDAPFSKLQISFKAKLGNITEGDSMIFGAYDETTGTITVAGKMANPVQNREVPVVFTFNYLNYTGPGDRIAISHSHNHTSDWGFEIDSLWVIALPNCFPPTDVTAHNTRYPNTAADVYFTWSRQGGASQWQVYMDTITSTVSPDSVPVSQLITVYDTVYTPEFGTMADGAKYRFFVRSRCSANDVSNWVELQNGVGTDEVWMNNSATADTVSGCSLIVYDNGGPVAGYAHNSNSNLVIRSGEDGRQPQITGGFVKLGDHTQSLYIYDGEGTNGTVLFSTTASNYDSSFTSVLATSTTGALTIAFSSGYDAAAGYEFYISCQGQASCPFPTALNATMTTDSTADVSWQGTAANYSFYYRLSGATSWNHQNVSTTNVTLTGLVPDTVYDMYVVALCSATDSSIASPVRHLNTHIGTPEIPCSTPSNLTVSNITFNSAVIGWLANGTENIWRLEVNGTLVDNVTTNPYTLTGLTPATQYTLKVQAVCDVTSESAWSTELIFTTAQEDSNTTYYTITATANNPAMGNVYGGGTYAENSVIELRAVPNAGYHFVEWNDGVSDSVRSVTVTGDMTFVATFAQNSGIIDVSGSQIVLFPNPASSKVTLQGIEGLAQVTVVDMNGRMVYTQSLSHSDTQSLTIDVSQFAKGAYFVRITGEHNTAIRKLIVK